MSGRVYLLGVGLVLVAVGFLATEAALGPRPGVTEANVNRIRSGMSHAEVAAILGSRGEWGLSFNSMDRYYATYGWRGPQGIASVTFLEMDQGRRVDRVRTAVFRRAAGPSPLARLRTWLGW